MDDIPYKGYTIRYKQAVYEICSLRDGVPVVVEDSVALNSVPSGFFAYGFNNNELFDTVEALYSAIDAHKG